MEYTIGFRAKEGPVKTVVVRIEADNDEVAVPQARRELGLPVERYEIETLLSKAEEEVIRKRWESPVTK